MKEAIMSVFTSSKPDSNRNSSGATSVLILVIASIAIFNAGLGIHTGFQVDKWREKYEKLVVKKAELEDQLAYMEAEMEKQNAEHKAELELRKLQYEIEMYKLQLSCTTQTQGES